VVGKTAVLSQPAADFLARAQRLGHRVTADHLAPRRPPVPEPPSRGEDKTTLRRLLFDRDVERRLEGPVMADHPSGKPYRYDRVLLQEALAKYAAMPAVTQLAGHLPGDWADADEETLLETVIAAGAQDLVALLPGDQVEEAGIALQSIYHHLGIIEPTFTDEDREHREYGPFAITVARLKAGTEQDCYFLYRLQQIQPVVAKYRRLPEDAKTGFLPWLRSRSVTGKVEQMTSLLFRLPMLELEASVRNFRVHQERAVGAPGNEAVAAEGQVIKSLSSSQTLAAVADLISPDSVKDNVVVLEPGPFADRYIHEYFTRNPEQDQDARLEKQVKQMQRIDRIKGFQSKLDGKIYVRAGIVSQHLVTHESMHKLGGDALEVLLGHHMAEGATELIAQQISNESGVEFDAFEFYFNEIDALKSLMEEASISLPELVHAYFSNDISTIKEKLLSVGTEKGLEELRSYKDPLTAFIKWSEQKPL